jgi:hypothetical protein
MAGSAFAVSSCAHDDSTIFVKQVLAEPLVTNGQVCTFTSDPTQPYVTHGILDTAIRSDYEAEFLVGNQMVPRGDPSAPRTETSYVNIQGAVVTITTAGGMQLASYTTLAAATIPPSNGTSPSYAPIDVTIIDSMTVGALQTQLQAQPAGTLDRVVTKVKFFGKTLGGESVESNEFAFPVDVCYGCLVSVCAASSTMTTLPVPCRPGQDSVIDCTQCQGIPVCTGPANCPCVRYTTFTIPTPDGGTVPVDAGGSGG